MSERSEPSPEEKIILQLAVHRKSFLITGCAGTGKSEIIKNIIHSLIQNHVYKKDEIGVTAMTGIASININGKTLSSFMGIGIEKTWKKMLKKMLKKSKTKSKSKWRKTKCLIIDEVSMFGGDHFYQLHKLYKHLFLEFYNKETETCLFEQIILIGDFFQLPPIRDTFLFESKIFFKYIEYVVELKTIYRQNDPIFIEILKEVRYARLSEWSKCILKLCIRKLDISDGIIPTVLFSLNQNVDNYNTNQLNKLNGDSISYNSVDTNCNGNSNLLDKYTLVPNNLKLKTGAQVMYLRNNLGLYNGSRGVVLNFKDRLPIVRFANGIITQVCAFEFEYIINKDTSNSVTISRKQLPLKLAWAVTIHKSQGLTIDKVVISTKNIFEKGQFYVALSRVRSLAGLQLLDFYPEKIKTNEKVMEFYALFNDEVKSILEEKSHGIHETKKKRKERKEKKEKKKKKKKKNRKNRKRKREEEREKGNRRVKKRKKIKTLT